MANMKSAQGGDATAAVKEQTADGPRAPKPSRSRAKEPPASINFGAAYSDPSTVGWYDERASFEAAGGTPSPRQRAQRGEDIGLTHTEPGDSLPSGVPVPID
jgi:hypothetical protein